jgi:methylated-DNA-protein-cysteine methyltransferase-like protein
MEESTIRILTVLRSLPAGRVISYRKAASTAGLPNGARQVARILHSLARKEGLPWHRVVRSDGSIALPEGDGRELQIALLRAEGVIVNKDGRVDLTLFEI